MSLFYRSFSSSSFSNSLSSNFSAPSRRQFIQGIGISSLLASNISLGKSLKNPENLLSPNQPNELTGNLFDLHVGYQAVNFSGKARIATTVNHGMPGPL